MTKRTFAVAAAAGLLAFTGVAAAAETASAQSVSRHRSTSVSGPNHSATRNTNVYRSPGSASVTRSGTVDSQAWSSARSRSTVATDDGYATSATRVGPAGNVQTRSGSTSCDGDSCSRSSSVQTSNGYGYDRQVDAYRTEDGVTVSRSATTNGGASRSSSVTRPY